MAEKEKSVQPSPPESDDIFDIYQSTCLKGVAIIMLIFHHCFLSPSRYKGQEVTFIIPEILINYVALFFKICVCLFVFISAYALTKKMMTSLSLQEADQKTVIRTLITSRLIRLLAGFVFVLLLVDLFALFYDPHRFAEIYGRDFPEAPLNFLLDMLGLAELLGTPTFLGTYWYYSLAIILIILCPFFYLLLEKTGPVPFLALVAVVNFTVPIQTHNIWHYFLCIGVGVVSAYTNIITRIVRMKIKENPLQNKLIKFFLGCLMLLALMLGRESGLKGELYPFWDAVIPVVLTSFCCEFVFPIPGIKQVLFFLGKYSANIFLVHNYIRRVWFMDFTYSFRYPLLITAMLLLNSLIISILIEGLKKLLHYNQFVSSVVRRMI